MKRIPFVARIAIAVLLAGLAAPGVATAAEPLPTVIMISLDGTRPADLSLGRLPAVVALAERGAQAERLLPSFPSNTFPNHVTLTSVECFQA